MEKVLIVDDKSVNRKLLSHMLITIGDYCLIEADSGLAAIECYKSEAPDLIFMDVMMPKMDGYQAAAQLKELMCENHVPIIFVTALSADQSLAKSLACGGDDFISKPLDREILMSKVEAHLRIRHLNQQLNEKNQQLLLHNQKLLREQELVKHFFDQALAHSFLDTDVIQFHMSSMSAFNGDLLLVERGPTEKFYMVVGDFSGHGLSAAMGTLPVTMIFFTMVQKGCDLQEIVTELNAKLFNLMPREMFFAATLVEIDFSLDRMQFWSGGMPEMYWFDQEGGLKEEIAPAHVALGILDEDSFDAKLDSCALAAGDKFYFYSDGVIEALDENGEMFGSTRLKDTMLASSENRFAHILQRFKHFTGNQAQADDITLVELSYR